MILDELLGYLSDQGAGTGGTNLFAGQMPDKPDTATAILLYPGRPPEYEQDDNLPAFEYPRVQILCRDPSYPAAFTKALLAWHALSGVTNVTLAGVLYQAIRPLSSPFFLRRDERNRAEIVCNYEITKQRG